MSKQAHSTTQITQLNTIRILPPTIKSDIIVKDRCEVRLEQGVLRYTDGRSVDVSHLTNDNIKHLLRQMCQAGYQLDVNSLQHLSTMQDFVSFVCYPCNQPHRYKLTYLRARLVNGEKHCPDCELAVRDPFQLQLLDGSLRKCHPEASEICVNKIKEVLDRGYVLDASTPIESISSTNTRVKYTCMPCKEVKYLMLKDIVFNKETSCRKCISLKFTTVPPSTSDHCLVSAVQVMKGLLANEQWARTEGGYISSSGRAVNVNGHPLMLYTDGRVHLNGTTRHAHLIWEEARRDATRLVPAHVFHQPQQVVEAQPPSTTPLINFEDVIAVGRRFTTPEQPQPPQPTEDLSLFVFATNAYTEKGLPLFAPDASSSPNDHLKHFEALFRHQVAFVFNPTLQLTVYENGHIWNNTMQRFVGVCKKYHKPTPDPKDLFYLYFTSKNEMMYVHRVVCMAFHPISGRVQYEDYRQLQVNHINGNICDNSASNLEWCTPSHNLNHAYQNDLNLKKRRVIQYRDDDDVLTVLRTYDSVAQAARETNMDEQLIRDCCKKNLVIDGITFKYEKEDENELWSSKFRHTVKKDTLEEETHKVILHVYQKAKDGTKGDFVKTFYSVQETAKFCHISNHTLLSMRKHVPNSGKCCEYVIEEEIPCAVPQEQLPASVLVPTTPASPVTPATPVTPVPVTTIIRAKRRANAEHNTCAATAGSVLVASPDSTLRKMQSAQYPDLVVYEDGKVYSLSKEMFLTVHLRDDKYPILYYKDKEKISLDRLVCTAFHPMPQETPENAQTTWYVQHIDQDLQNCKADNLRWVDRKTVLNHHADTNERLEGVRQYAVNPDGTKGELVRTFASIAQMEREAQVTNYLGKETSVFRKDIDWSLKYNQPCKGYFWEWSDAQRNQEYRAKHSEELRRKPNVLAWKRNDDGTKGEFVGSFKSCAAASQATGVKGNTIQIILQDQDQGVVVPRKAPFLFEREKLE